MKIEFMYSPAYDLMYHILAHMEINNASNLYSEEYINQINQAKAGQFADLTAELAPLTAYYNENFDRLAMINFLPFYCSDVNALIHTLMHFDGFTAENKESFILPLIEIMKAENIFYEPYRLRLHEQAASSRTTLEDYLSTELTKYSKLFAYLKKEHAIIGMSYSMTCNGRGFGNPQASAFSAIVPFVNDKAYYKNTFLQILHEYTHQFTDALLQQNISMDDGSHFLSEQLVILFDYYLIKELCPEDVSAYFRYLSPEAETGGPIMTEDVLFQIFGVLEHLNQMLLDLVNKISEVSL